MSNLITTNTGNSTFLDTNYLIGYYFGDLHLEKNINTEYYISRINYIEFLSHTKYDRKKASYMSTVLNNDFEIVEVDSFLADIAADLRRKEKGLKTADSIVLASALDLRADLLTLDKQLKSYFDKWNVTYDPFFGD